jgi:hypothetical protein
VAFDSLSGHTRSTAVYWVVGKGWVAGLQTSNYNIEGGLAGPMAPERAVSFDEYGFLIKIKYVVATVSWLRFLEGASFVLISCGLVTWGFMPAAISESTS